MHAAAANAGCGRSCCSLRQRPHLRHGHGVLVFQSLIISSCFTIKLFTSYISKCTIFFCGTSFCLTHFQETRQRRRFSCQELSAINAHSKFDNLRRRVRLSPSTSAVPLLCCRRSHCSGRYGSLAAFAVMCPATQYWQRTLANTVGKLVTEYVIFNLE